MFYELLFRMTNFRSPFHVNSYRISSMAFRIAGSSPLCSNHSFTVENGSRLIWAKLCSRTHGSQWKSTAVMPPGRVLFGFSSQPTETTPGGVPAGGEIHTYHARVGVHERQHAAVLVDGEEQRALDRLLWVVAERLRLDRVQQPQQPQQLERRRDLDRARPRRVRVQQAGLLHLLVRHRLLVLVL
ncbi:hypothetical protein DL765_011586 [Monosporascus sp. GIB2]|nr:hypothetical protein DL765_011586 [Monosporascus sp. GIB2]